MITYFDPITQEEAEVNADTILYLVKIGANSYSIKGLSKGIEQLPADPTTQAQEYWKLDTKVLLEKETQNNLLFPANKLTTQTLTEAEVIANLGFDPNNIAPTKFILPPRLNLQPILLGIHIGEDAYIFFRPPNLFELSILLGGFNRILGEHRLAVENGNDNRNNELDESSDHNYNSPPPSP